MTTSSEPRIQRVTPLRKALERIDSASNLTDPTEIVLAAAKAIKMAEHGWRVGRITLLGRLPISEKLELIKPPNSIRAALDRFGGHDWGTPTIRIDRGGRHEVWTDIHIDDAGLDWLNKVCCVDIKRLPNKIRTEADIAHAAEHDTEAECRDWLIELMQQGGPGKRRGYYEDIARERFGLTVRAFRRAWDAAIEATGADSWRKRGPKVRFHLRGRSEILVTRL